MHTQARIRLRNAARTEVPLMQAKAKWREEFMKTIER